MTFLDLVGTSAGVFVILAFYCVEQTRMRWFALASNILFVFYAWSLDLQPIVILHTILMLLNIRRLSQLQRCQTHSVCRQKSFDRTLYFADADLRLAVSGARLRSFAA